MTASFYSVIQYVPDPVTGERVNVGVVTVRGEEVHAKFLTDWRRIRSFGGEDLDFLKEFARAAQSWSKAQDRLPGLEERVRLNEQGIRNLAGKWINTVQFTELKASLLDPSELLIDAANRFLRTQPRRRRGFRDRRAAAALARNTIEMVVQDVVGSRWRELVRRNDTVAGRFDDHRFDVSVKNGDIMLAVRALSFEGPASHELEREVDATAWALDDVRKARRDIELAVAALPPRTRSKTFDSARRVFEGLEASFVVEDDLQSWAAAMTMEAFDGTSS